MFAPDSPFTDYALPGWMQAQAKDPFTVTTMALGEEGGDYAIPSDPLSPPPDDIWFTTCAIGEEGGDGLIDCQRPWESEPRVVTRALGEESGDPLSFPSAENGPYEVIGFIPWDKPACELPDWAEAEPLLPDAPPTEGFEPSQLEPGDDPLEPVGEILPIVLPEPENPEPSVVDCGDCWVPPTGEPSEPAGQVDDWDAPLDWEQYKDLPGIESPEEFFLLPYPSKDYSCGDDILDPILCTFADTIEPQIYTMTITATVVNSIHVNDFITEFRGSYSASHRSQMSPEPSPEQFSASTDPLTFVAAPIDPSATEPVEGFDEQAGGVAPSVASAPIGIEASEEAPPTSAPSQAIATATGVSLPSVGGESQPQIASPTLSGLSLVALLQQTSRKAANPLEESLQVLS